MDKMKICFITWNLGIAGGVRAIFEVANGLSERGYSVEILALGGYYNWFDVRVPVRYVSIPPPLNNILSLYRVLRLRRKSYYVTAVEGFAKKFGFHADLIKLLAENIPKADIHIATWYPTALALWFAEGKSKKFYFLQDFPELVLEVSGKYGLRVFDVTLRLPFDAFLCNSSYTKNLVLERQPNARTIITGIGVNTQVFKPCGSRLMKVKGKGAVMIILRGLKFKGDDVSVKALNIVTQKHPIHALIVGKSSTVKKLFNSVKPQFTYEIFEDVNDYMLAKLYSSADVFLFTSYAESFGLPPLEAMACGTPVVTTDCIGNRDYAINEVNSLIVPPGDVKALAEAVIRVLNSSELRKKLIEGGLRTAEQWKWDSVVDKFEQAIKGI